MIHKLFIRTLALSLVAMGCGTAAFAQDTGTTTGSTPRLFSAPIRVIPLAGASSFATSNTLQTDRFGDGFSAGILIDIGESYGAFETGAQTFTARNVSTGNRTAVDINSWGIPLLGKLNFSGKPHETVFAKAGVMPFFTSGGTNRTDIMGVAGLGADIPLGRSTALVLDASYNRLFTNDGELTDYQGLALLGGLSFNL